MDTIEQHTAQGKFVRERFREMLEECPGTEVSSEFYNGWCINMQEPTAMYRFKSLHDFWDAFVEEVEFMIDYNESYPDDDMQDGGIDALRCLFNNKYGTHLVIETSTEPRKSPWKLVNEKLEGEPHFDLLIEIWRN